MLLTSLAIVALATGCGPAESDAIIREHAHMYADCVNSAVDEAIASDQNRLVVENRVMRCGRFFESIHQDHGVTMEDNAHNFEVWIAIVRPAEKRVKAVPLPDPKCQLTRVEQCPPERK